MKNLKLYSEVSQNIQLHSTEEVVQFAAYDIDQSRLFFASSANFVYSLQLSSFQVSQLLSMRIRFLLFGSSCFCFIRKKLGTLFVLKKGFCFYFAFDSSFLWMNLQVNLGSV